VVLFNYAIREVTAKLVYYGPGLCGKTTNLQFIHEKLAPSARGKLLSLATAGDRTLFFDFLPIEMGSIGGYKVRFQLYTVPGQVHYNATRKLVLKGVDAVAFVADSQLSMVERNRESFENLIENLIENGYDPARIPVVIQLNKRDLQNVASVGDLVAAMGVEGYPVVEAVASRGDGVFETLKTIVKLTLLRLRTQFDAGTTLGTARPEPPPPPPPPPPPAVVFAPAPPPPPEVEADAAAVAIEGLDEFDLEDFAAEAAAPVVAAGPDIAPGEDNPEEDVVDLEADMETLMDGQFVSGDGSPDNGVGSIAVAEIAASGFESVMADEDGWPVATPLDATVVPAAATFTSEPPPWAVELMAEMQRLRAENSGLRAALRGIKTLLDRQVDVLREGREELERHVGENPGESAS